MSNAGQAILTVVGTVVGTYFGYPQLGFVLGSLAGQALFPTQLPGVTGPKLTDGNTTSAQVGDPVVWLFGRDWSAGEVVFLDAIETVTNTDHQGKGGPSQDFTTFSYFQSIGLGICEGEDIATGKGRKSLIAVWENGELKFDIREQRADEAEDAYAARLESSAEYAQTFVFYEGSEEQLPDPTIEAVRGIGNTPAFRGLCWIMYPGRQLQDKQAQRHPAFRFLVDDCTLDFNATKIYLSSGTWRKPAGLLTATPRATGGGGGGQAGSNAQPSGTGLASGGTGGGGGGASQDTIAADDLPATVAITVGFGGDGGEPNPSPLAFGLSGEDGEDSSFGDLVVGGGGHGGGPLSPAGSGGSGTLAGGGAGGIGGIGPSAGQSTSAAPDGVHPFGFPAGAGGAGGGGGTQFGGAEGGVGGDGEADPDGPPPGAEGGGGGTDGDGNSTPVKLAGPGFAGHDSLIHSGGGGGGGGGGARNAPGNKGGAGGNFGGGGGGGGGSTIGGTGDRGGPGAKGIVIVEQDFGEGSPCVETRLISEIVTRICARVNLTAIDVSQIGDTEVDGYGLRRQMNARSAIDPLRSVGWFDVVESGRSLKFVRRGGAMVAQLTEDDLGAHEYGGQPIPAITTKKSQSVDLPRVVRVHYFAVSRDYEFGEAHSPPRISSRATNDMDVELPINLSDQLASEVAEALWADLWAGDNTYETTVDRSWIVLEGTDPIGVPVDGFVERMRIQSITDSSVLLRKLTLIRDDDDSYDPVAVGTTPERPPDQINIKAPTALVLLDLPPLRPEDDDPGIYAAVGPMSGSSWQGAVIFRSCDSGATTEALTGQLLASLIGTLAQPLSGGLPEIPDLGNTLVVDFPSYSSTTPASVTLEQLLEGANAFAIGQDGRWEIGQFQTAEQIGANQWALTVLLRGRRGTEHVMGSSLAGDTFVLLDENTITRLPVPEVLIGETCTYRPVTVGTTYAANADQDQDLEHHGVALLPFSPVDVVAELSGGDALISWNPRDRIGQVLPPDGVFPMSEDTEAYEVDVVSAGNVVRTLMTSTNSATYTAAQMATDGVTAGGLLFRVYQISATVGRGTPGAAFLT